MANVSTDEVHGWPRMTSGAWTTAGWYMPCQWVSWVTGNAVQIAAPAECQHKNDIRTFTVIDEAHGNVVEGRAEAEVWKKLGLGEDDRLGQRLFGRVDNVSDSSAGL